MRISELRLKQKVAILGFGKEGKSTLNFLLKLGLSIHQITIIDQNIITDGNIKIKNIHGKKYLDSLQEFDIIIKSPGISPYHKKILPVRDKITSQTEIFFNNYSGKIIGITATKGKSTTASLLYETLKEVEYNVKLVGNIGTPVLDQIDILSDDLYEFIIYELSSYMLETCVPECDIAVLGNIYTCHLDWHDNKFSVYEQAKLNILKKSDNKIISEDFAKYVTDNENTYLYGIHSEYGYSDTHFLQGEKELFSLENVLLLGEHNKKNISCVVVILSVITQKYKNNSPWIFSKLTNALQDILTSFSGLPHRMEKIGTYNYITFIDDGISTTPESTIEALKTFGNKINTLFLGGGDYGFTQESYTLLKEYIIQYKVENIVLFPDTGLDIFNIKRDSLDNDSIFTHIYNNFSINILYTNNMEHAVQFAYKYSGKENICIMSCAAPSYSLWSGYEEKGKLFKEYIELYKKLD
ncbi:MAG: UDP-N-acetylmuramoyl-L-alanine--D-glutamate ligase [Candidatus Gracilibacteria bacterium]|nr:UDP-N-acetylmuramoyl-L-alanine--D-glutamate ligase [Candidatus Gracilibacteria bacterium]